MIKEKKQERYYKTVILLTFLIGLGGCVSSEKQTPNQTNSVSESKTQPTAIRVSLPERNANEPSIAVAADGTILVVWVEHKTKKEADVMLQSFYSDGRKKTEQVRVNPQENAATAWRGDQPTIKIGLDGTIYVVWTARVEAEKKAANILYLSVSRNGGNSFDAPVKINDDTAPASHGMHSLAVDNEGRIFAAWLDERYLNSQKEQASGDADFRFEKAAFLHHKKEEETEPNAELYFAVSNDGGKTFSANKKLVGDACPCCKATLLAGADGNIYVGWRQVLKGDFRHIAVAVSKDKGNTFSAPAIVSDDKWQINACPISGAALALNSDKSLLVLWFTAGEAGKRGLYLANSKDGGKTFSPRTLVSESTISGTPQLLADKTGKKKIIWSDAGKLFTSALAENSLTIENKQEIGESVLPAAAISDGKIIVADIKSEGEKATVFLSIIDK